MTVFEFAMRLLDLPYAQQQLTVVVDDGHELCELLAVGAPCDDQDLIQHGNIQHKAAQVFVIGQAEP